MYKIINLSDGENVGYVEHPYFIKKKASTGCFIRASEEEAQGIAHKNMPYNLQGREGLGVDKTVVLIECDTAEGMNDEIAASEGRTDDVLCEMDMSIEDIKEALCEIDEIINGGE